MTADLKSTLSAAREYAKTHPELRTAVRLAMGTAAAARKYPNSKPVQELLRAHLKMLLAQMEN